MLLLSFKDICVVLCLFVCQFPALFSLAPTGDFFCFVLTGKKLWIKNTFPKRRKDAGRQTASDGSAGIKMV